MYDEHEHDESEVGNDDGTSLVKDLRRQIKAHAKANKELAEQLAAFQSASRGAELQTALSQRGLPENVADLIPADADVSEWLDSYGGLFGAKPAPQGTAPAGEQDANLKALADAHARTARVESAATPESDDLVTRMRAAKSPDELEALLASLRPT